MRVVVVDDDALSLTAQTKALWRWGFEVIALSSGSGALRIYQEDNPPPLLLLDVMMPSPDGIEVCKTIRSRSLRISPYIILLTAQTPAEGLVAGLDAGANDYIHKPFNLNELRARVQVGVRMIELQEKLVARMTELETALSNVRRLEGLLPMCSSCKKIRDDQGYWNEVEKYLTDHSEATFSHGMCPHCAQNYFPEQFQLLEQKRNALKE